MPAAVNALPAVLDLTPETLAAFAAERGLPRHLPGQVLRWVYERGTLDPDEMTDLAKSTRETLRRELRWQQSDTAAHQRATDGTQKLLLSWTMGANDGGDCGSRLPLPVAGTPVAATRQTECVMIPTEQRRTACVSSQVGCPVGCAFCASGIGGLEGNLTCGQIVEQVWRLGRLDGVGRISHVVFMGMGEPLANYAAVTDAIRTLNAPWGLGISARRITVSTVGLPAAIRRLVGFEIPVTLALSLHAPNDELRRQIIPWAEYATIAELLDACHEWFRKTGREITLEYILLGGFNDQGEHARELAAVARSLRANVNLIRYNEVRGMPFDRPATGDVRRFQEILRKQGVNAHIRASRGRDIAAACGQLRREAG
ncbi:MAG: 23S rRNA (adenine(2503)-C(2))-methyltransferase RlmN, partial [Phycisphaerales bacterium]|nr:23S rRNA (adenine(2503)-C(2))-methyltransferase RlmN [Phycisphaerales bacterium]